jgi:HK97 family phage prohead protease
MTEMVYRALAAPSPSSEPDEFVLSDATVDRLGDVVEPRGWKLDRLVSEPIALFNHNRDHIIGMWKDVRVQGGKLIGRLVWDTGGKSPLTEHLRSLVQQGILRTVSVGFQPLKSEPIDPKEPFRGKRFVEQLLMEASLVSVPANPNAIAIAIAKSLPHDVYEAIFRKSATEDPGLTRALPGKSATTSPSGRKPMSETLSARIQTERGNLNLLRDRLAEIVNQEQPSDDDVKRGDELPDEIEAALSRIASLERQERALAGNVPAKPMPSEARNGEIIVPERRPFAMPKKKTPEPEDFVYRALTCWSISNGPERPPLERALRERYGNDEATGVVLRAAVNPAQTGVAGWASELVQTSNVGFLDRLIPNFIYPTLSGRGSKYTFGPTAGHIKIPTRTTSQTLAGAWVAEAAPKPVKRLSFSSITLEPYKLAVISTFSEEMAMYSTPAIEGIIRQAMSSDTGIALDSYLIDAVAASAGVRPAGLLNGVTPLTATASGTATEKMIADFKQLLGALTAAGSDGTNIVVLVNPAQALSMNFAMTTTGDFLFGGTDGAGQRFGVSIITSATVAAGRVIAIDADEFATATGDTPRFAVSNEATLHEEDTTPLAIGTTGAPATVAAPARSLFQTDSIAIRLSLHVSWAMRRTGMVQTIASVGW